MNKSLKDISWQVPEEEYRADPAYSYSLLAKYERGGFNCLSTLFDKVESPALTFGSIVDCLVTEGEEAFYQKYAVASLPEVSDSLKKIAEAIKLEYPSTRLENIPDEVVDRIALNAGYYTNLKTDTRVKKIRDGITYYYDTIISINGKELVSSNDYNDAINCLNALKNNEEINNLLFTRANPFSNKEVLYQLKFKGEAEGLAVKCMADALYVDYDTKTIIPIDLKTSSKPEWEFCKSFIDWNYYIQAQLYWYIIRQNLDKDPYFEYFNLMPYKFIVVNKKTLTPMVWEYEHTADSGDVTLEKDIKLRSFITIMKELDKYLKGNYTKPIGMSTFNKIETYII